MDNVRGGTVQETTKMNRFRTSPLARLNLRYPLIQAPMAGTSTPALAAAVSNAGALGSIGLGASNAKAALKTIQETQALTDRPFNVNFFVHATAKRDVRQEKEWVEFLRPAFGEFGAQPPAQLEEIYRSLNDDAAMLDVLFQTKPQVVSFHFGLPRPSTMQRLKEDGAVLLATATSLSEARAIQEAGLDMVVAQGFEAGGHRGVFDPDAEDAALTTSALTALIRSTLEIPVVAAGGIMDGRGIASALALGASAVQLGTAFILCPESAADEGFRKALRGPGAYRTRLTSLISGRPARCLENRFTALHQRLDGRTQPSYPVTYDAGKALHAAAKAKGEHGYGAHWAGQGAPLAREMPAAEMVRTLMQEAEGAWTALGS